jgi:anti-sigma-K factor RskA
VESNAAELSQTIEALALAEAATQNELLVMAETVEEISVDQNELAVAVEEETSVMEQVDELLAEVVVEQTELASRVKTVATNESEMMDIVKDQRTLTYMAATPDRSVNLLWSASQTASARGMIFMSNDGRIGLLAVLDLPPLPDDQVYQIWLIKGGSRISGGTFTVDSSGYGQTILQLVAPVGEFDAIAITVEPAGGSNDPTTDQVLVGDL